MGLNISIANMQTGEDIFNWCTTRHFGDREAVEILSNMPRQSVPSLKYEDVFFMRPDSIEDFRAALHAAIKDNSARWDQMCDLLAEDTNRGICFSW